MTFSSMQSELQKITDSKTYRLQQAIKKEYLAAYNKFSIKLGVLYSELSVVEKKDYYNHLLKGGRLEKLIKDLSGELKTINKNLGIQTATHLEDVVDLNYYGNLFSISGFSKPIFQKLNKKAVERLVYGYSERISFLAKQPIKQPYTFVSMIKGNQKKDLQKVRSTMAQMFIQGQGYNQAAASVKDVFNNSFFRASRVIRTESHRVAEEVNFISSQVAKENGIKIRRQWIALTDDRTRDSHRDADGQFEDDSGNFTVGGTKIPYPGGGSDPAENINCRCRVIQVIDGLEPTKRTFVDPVTKTSRTADFATINEWRNQNGVPLGG
jgi:SPP1 gp7 family putative phage head morphogenesis protein